MSCPHFEPKQRLPWERWKGRFRPPLGALHEGLCRVNGEAETPPPELLLECCNMGYARGRCPRLKETAADASRFEIARQEGGLVEVLWLLERHCLPAASGRAIYDRRHAALRDADAPGVVPRQIEVFVRNLVEDADG